MKKTKNNFSLKKDYKKLLEFIPIPIIEALLANDMANSFLFENNLLEGTVDMFVMSTLLIIIAKSDGFNNNKNKYIDKDIIKDKTKDFK